MNSFLHPATAPAAPFGLELDETAARVAAVVQVARYHGVELDPEALRPARFASAGFAMQQARLTIADRMTMRKHHKPYTSLDHTSG